MMLRVRRFLQNTPGQKAVVAVTGIILFGFVLSHMAGNLKSFLGVEADGRHAVDHYAEGLRALGEPLLPHGLALWGMRAVLLGAFVLHIVTVIGLTKRNRSARTQPYVRQQEPATNLAARSMLITGIFLAAFVVFHILHFTTGTIRMGSFEHGKVYANLYYSFQGGLAAFMYLLATAAVGLHLFHGAWSLFQTLGLDSPDRNAMLRKGAMGAAFLIAVGFVAVPLMFFFGLLDEPTGAAAHGVKDW